VSQETKRFIDPAGPSRATKEGAVLDTVLILAITGVAFLEAAGPLSLLTPGEVVIVAAGAALGLDPVVLGASGIAVALGALLGSTALYLVTRAVGRGRWPRLARPLNRALPRRGRLASLTRRRSAWILVAGRFVAVGRAAIPIVAAQARVPFARFALWTGVGTLLWSAWLLGLGAGVGRGAEAFFPRQLGWSLAGVAVILVGLAVLRSRRRRIGHAVASPSSREEPGT
jgi:membrane-associated protein